MMKIKITTVITQNKATAPINLTIRLQR